MIMPVKAGSIVALVTPMTADNSIDYVKLEGLLRWHVAEGKTLKLKSIEIRMLTSKISD